MFGREFDSRHLHKKNNICEDVVFFVEVGGCATPPCVTHPQTPSCEGACRYAPLSTTKAAKCRFLCLWRSARVGQLVAPWVTCLRVAVGCCRRSTIGRGNQLVRQLLRYQKTKEMSFDISLLRLFCRGTRIGYFARFCSLRLTPFLCARRGADQNCAPQEVDKSTTFCSCYYALQTSL